MQMSASSSSNGLPDAPDLPSPVEAAFLCDAAGNVLRVLYANDATSGFESGRTFFSALDGPSLAAASLFLRSVADTGFARSLGVRIAGGPLLHLVGLRAHDALLVVATTNPLNAAIICDLAATDAPDEAASLLELSERIRGMDSSYALYGELAQLNNELVTAQRELARTVAELRRVNAYKNELLGIAAHDLRNPLNASMAFIGFLYEDADLLSEQNATILDRLRRSTAFMLRLVDDVLQYSAIEAGAVRLRLEEASLEHLVRDVVETMRILAERRRVAIRYRGADVPRMRLDVVKLAQSLQNLITNAVKFSPRGGTVDVRLTLDDARARAAIEVTDRGPGIPAEELRELYQPFRKLSPQPAGGDPSTGLGLAITRRLIEAHGGSVEVESEVGKGTTFRLVLPLTTPA